MISDIEQKYMFDVYPRRPITIVKGRGALVWDENGKEYIDCVGGWGVCSVGHCHPKIIEAVKKQSETLIMCPCTFYNDVRARFLEKIVSLLPEGLNKIFITNSGTESVECALKVARRHTGKKEIIATKRGFHGRSFGSLSATWKPKYREPFGPLVPGFKHVEFGSVEEAEREITDETAAIIVEPVQGESGVYIAPDDYLKGLRKICDKNGVLLIFDEVQTGFGRTGKLFAFQHWNVIPDILCLAKALGGGVPIGVTVTREDIAGSLQKGEHGSTFGGNPLACAAGIAAVDVIINEGLPERAASLGQYFRSELERLAGKYKCIREVRGLGLMLAVEFRFPIVNVVEGSMERGLLVLPTGLNIIRLLPPLVIERDQIDRVVLILDEVCDEFEKGSPIS